MKAAVYAFAAVSKLAVLRQLDLKNEFPSKNDRGRRIETQSTKRVHGAGKSSPRFQAPQMDERLGIALEWC